MGHSDQCTGDRGGGQSGYYCVQYEPRVKDVRLELPLHQVQGERQDREHQDCQRQKLRVYSRLLLEGNCRNIKVEDILLISGTSLCPQLQHFGKKLKFPK